LIGVTGDYPVAIYFLSSASEYNERVLRLPPYRIEIAKAVSGTSHAEEL